MASAGLIALPAWADDWNREGLKLSSETGFMSEKEKIILASVADTIIPRSGNIGALDVGVDLFLTKLFTDCYDKEVQDNIRLQLGKLDLWAQETIQKPFINGNQPEKEALLNLMEASDDTDQNSFFELVKGETIRGFMTSRKVLMDYFEYVVAPGHFYGCIDLSTG